MNKGGKLPALMGVSPLEGERDTMNWLTNKKEMEGCGKYHGKTRKGVKSKWGWGGEDTSEECDL